MSGCQRIVPKTIPNNLPPEYYDSENKVVFDTLPVGYTKAKKRQEVVSGSVQGAGATPSKLPNTDKNTAILKALGYPGNGQPFTFRANIYDGDGQNPRHHVTINGRDKKCDYAYTLTNNGTDWRDVLNECTVCDINWPLFEFDQAWVDNNQANNASYTTFNQPYQVPPIDYGGLGNVEELYLEQLRPLVSDYYILRQLMCKAGYQFKAKYYDDGGGDNNWHYILKKNWYNYEGKGRLYNLIAESSANQDTGFVIEPFKPDTIIIDVGGNFDIVTGIYTYPNITPRSSPVNLCFKGSLQLDTNGDGPGGGEIIITFRKFTPSMGTTQTEAVAFPGLDPGQTITVDECYCFGGVLPGDQLFITIEGTATRDLPPPPTIIPENVTILAGSQMCVEVKGKRLYSGDIINMVDLLDCNITGMMVLEAMSHIYKWQFQTEGNCITAYTPRAATAPNGETVEGFRLPKYKAANLTPHIDPKCVTQTAKLVNDKRNQVLCWGESDDEYITLEGLETDTPLYSYNIDLLNEGIDSGQLEAGENENCNPHIQPTAIREVTEILPNGVGGEAVFLPVMWGTDSNDGANISHCIEWRMICSIGVVEQDGTALVPRQYVYQGTTQTQIATAFMAYDGTINGGADVVDCLDWREIYENIQRKCLIEQFLTLDYKLVLYLTNCQYEACNFRELIFLEVLTNCGYLQGYFEMDTISIKRVCHGSLNRVDIMARKTQNIC